MADTENAFVEGDEGVYRRKSIQKIRLHLNPDGSFDWESTPQKNIDLFLNAIKVDPAGILKNIKEEAGEKIAGTEEDDTEIADTTVLTCVNIVMMLEAIGICSIGPRYASVLKNLHPAVAAKACAVSMEEIQPILPAGKRIIHRYLPTELLSQEWQDIFIVGEHLMQMSYTKFKACVDLAVEIEKYKSGQTASGPNGKVIDVEPDPTEHKE